MLMLMSGRKCGIPAMEAVIVEVGLWVWVPAPGV